MDHPDLLPRDLRLAPTYMVSTHRGYHLYYQGDLRTKAYPWGEVRGGGSYVVGPGSTHASGDVYEALDDDLEIVGLPDHLTHYLSGKEGVTSTEYNLSSDTPRRSYPPDRQRGIDVRSYFCDPHTAIRAVQSMGYDVDTLGRPFRCPFHPEDSHPSAALYQGESSQVFIHDFHAVGTSAEWRTIPDLYFRKVSGQDTALSHGGYAVWGLRLLSEIGAITLPAVDVPDLPDKAPNNVKHLWERFVLLLRCREFYLPGQCGAPFSYGFATAWCGLPDKVYAARGIRWLQKHQVLATLPKEEKRDATLYVAVEADVETYPARRLASKLDDWLHAAEEVAVSV